MVAIKKISALLFLVFLLACNQEPTNGTYPQVILTKSAVKQIRARQSSLPILKQSIDNLSLKIDAEINNGIIVPIPKDPAGGFTHNQHKQNYITMYGAGTLWQLKQDSKYFDYVKNMLLEYAKMYPTLKEHPVKASYAPGRLFWQQLNEAVWLVYVSQAYDCIKGDLSSEDNDIIVNKLLIPYADFLSVENPKVFNKIHNHGVWAVSAVGMTGFALSNDELIHRAFNGVETGPKSKLGAGFMVQLDQLFSPDGYYTEGPYYQRYALLPYMLFAQAIENNKPEIKIFEHRNRILSKAVNATLQLTNTNGGFLPINDALKSMSYLAPELVHAVDIIYGSNQDNKQLLSIAKEQGRVIICEAGLRVAEAISANEEVPFQWNSVEFKDGPKGEQGAVGILRSNTSKESQSVIMKYASQGMGHGHFDRLTMMYYDRGNEVLQDYGAARYVNVEYKHGGRYLPENKTWARHTIAHNTLVVDEKSQSKGNVKVASKHSSDCWIFDASDAEVQIMSAKENSAYVGVNMHRTMALLSLPEIADEAIVVDVYRVNSDTKHKYQLPFYYMGEVMYTSIEHNANQNQINVLGDSDGFEHLWKLGEGQLKLETEKFVWQNKGTFYTISMEADNGKAIFARIGANDPQFNLRNEASIIFEKDNVSNSVFTSAIEAHGSVHPYTELVKEQKGRVSSVKTIYNNDDYTLVKVEFLNKKNIVLAICNSDNTSQAKHKLNVNDTDYNWSGSWHLFKNI